MDTPTCEQAQWYRLFRSTSLFPRSHRCYFRFLLYHPLQLTIFGTPCALTPDCIPISNANISSYIVTRNVGPFTVQGLDFAIAALQRAMARVCVLCLCSILPVFSSGSFVAHALLVCFCAFPFPSFLCLFSLSLSLSFSVSRFLPRSLLTRSFAIYCSLSCSRYHLRYKPLCPVCIL